MALLHHPGVDVLVVQVDHRHQAVVLVLRDRLQRHLGAFPQASLERSGRLPSPRLCALGRVDGMQSNDDRPGGQRNVDGVAVGHLGDAADQDGGLGRVAPRSTQAADSTQAATTSPRDHDALRPLGRSQPNRLLPLR